MRKPSIFSRDYEKRMKKRKKVFTALYISIFFILGFTVAAVSSKTLDFSGIRNNIQAWVDSGKPVEETEVPETPEVVTPVPEVPKITTVDLKVTDNKTIVFEYVESNGKVTFKEPKTVPEGIYYTVSPSKETVFTIDENQNAKLFNVKGEATNIGKDSYTAPNGEVFNKDNVLKTYKDYYWIKEAKFINDKKIAYISNIPYFGTGLNKYAAVIDIDTKAHTTLFQTKGKDVKLLDIKEKGLEVQVDGNLKYINNDGKLTN